MAIISKVPNLWQNNNNIVTCSEVFLLVYAQFIYDNNSEEMTKIA